MTEEWKWEDYEPHERIAVIGCGPAGLLAAWAAVRHGFKVEIFSPKNKTTQVGAQYVHAFIPGIISEEEAEPIHYSHVGSAEGYAEKIYGGVLAASDTSWFKFHGTHMAWPMGEVYARLWRFFEDGIIDCEVDMSRLEQIARHNHTVFSTMPLHLLLDPDKTRAHMFPTERIYGYPKMMTPDYARVKMPNVIVYNGWYATRWYRQSRIFGREWTEWPYSVGPEGVEEDVLQYGHEWNPLSLWTAVKPLVCHIDTKLELPPNVRLVGRYGQWRKGVLVHDAYAEASDYLEAISEMH